MKIGKRRKPPEPHIPFISLADIAWQIIIFFLLATTFVTNSALNVDIPATANVPRANQPPAKTLSVQASATQVLVDGKPVPLEGLQARVRQLLAGKKTEQERAVLLEGKDDLPFQRDAEIMYAIQQAGGVLVMQEDKP